MYYILDDLPIFVLFKENATDFAIFLSLNSTHPSLYNFTASLVALILAESICKEMVKS